MKKIINSNNSLGVIECLACITFFITGALQVLLVTVRFKEMSSVCKGHLECTCDNTRALCSTFYCTKHCQKARNGWLIYSFQILDPCDIDGNTLRFFNGLEIGHPTLNSPAASFGVELLTFSEK